MTRQRITGSLVLLLVAVILLPAIFDGQGPYQPPPVAEIPEPPPLPAVPEDAARRPDVLADSEAIRVERSPPQPAPVAPTPAEIQTEPALESETSVAQPEAQPSGDSTTASSRTPPQLDSRGLPEAWSVRLGAFSSQENVQSLVQRLQAAGHTAYTRPIQSAQGQLTGVFVGPRVDRSAAQRLQAELRDQFALEGQVVRYEIQEQ